MPASAILLGAFIGAHHKQITGATAKIWLCGLHLWHEFNDATWNGTDTMVLRAVRGATRGGVAFSRPERAPVTEEYLRALLASLDVSQPRDAAIWAAATSPFGGCRRLGEMLPISSSSFNPMFHVLRGVSIERSVVNGVKVISFRLPWTKTTGIAGGLCVLTATGTDICWVAAFENHLRVNAGVPLSFPLFSYMTPSGPTILIKPSFLSFCKSVFSSAQLAPVHGHSFRIGGCLFYLLSDVPPETVMKLGGWSSLCFLIYWRRLQAVLPSQITSSWSARIANFSSTHSLHEHDV